jgi:plasmid stability protein
MRGGYRENAGRKQGFAAKNAEEARRILSEMVMREIRPIGEALIAKAKKGDVIATRELFDRALGKASQSTKVQVESELPMPLLSALSVSTEAVERYSLRS